MHRVRVASLFFAAIFLSLFLQNGVWVLIADTGPGVIQGAVRYENGKPVKGAMVYAQPLDRPMASIVPHGKTDEAGHFAIAHLWLGKFAVGTEKLDEDYPNMTIQFYSDGKFETITLSSLSPTANVSILLGPKAGILSGTVTEGRSGVPLNPCVEFRRAKEPTNFLAGTGLINANYRVLVPPKTDVLMKVWHGGHKPWYYPGTTDKSKRRPLNLQPREEMKVDIRLMPDSNAPQDSCGMPVGTLVEP